MTESVPASPEIPEEEAARYQSLLGTGERILLVQKRHWFTILDAGRWFLLALAAGAITSAVNASIPDSGLTGPLSTLLGWAYGLFLLIGIVGTAWYALVWWKERYLVTTRRVVETGGVLSRYSRDTSLAMITDMLVSQPWLGRVFGFGELELLTASEAGRTKLRFLPDASSFKRTLLDAKYEHELELGGGGRSREGGVATGAPAARSSSTDVSGRISADEMDVALTHLGDLRQRGLLTEEEFEAKKKELLDRL
jgi:Bacterial PH domain/Short C-terminal domain